MRAFSGQFWLSLFLITLGLHGSLTAGPDTFDLFDNNQPPYGRAGDKGRRFWLLTHVCNNPSQGSFGATILPYTQAYFGILHAF